MQNVKVEVIRIQKEPEQRWWLVYEKDFNFIDVVFGTIVDVDLYRGSWHQENPGKMMMERDFTDEYELLKYVIKESDKDEIMTNLQHAKSRVDCIRLVISLQREMLIDSMIEEIKESKKRPEVNQNKLDNYTTAADEFYRTMEDGGYPNFHQLKNFMDGLVDVLESMGGRVKEGEEVK